jgi:hypothetical protein
VSLVGPESLYCEYKEEKNASFVDGKYFQNVKLQVGRSAKMFVRIMTMRIWLLK